MLTMTLLSFYALCDRYSRGSNDIVLEKFGVCYFSPRQHAIEPSYGLEAKAKSNC
jgi:hypothetical protein